MLFRRGSLLVSLGLLALACAGQKAPSGTSAPTKSAIASAEEAAEAGERELNAAEKELDALNPDPAEEKLEEARGIIFDSKLDAYPESQQIRERHRELTRRVPEVREEIRRRELAAAVKSAREKIDAARERLDGAIDRIEKKHPSEADLKDSQESLEALRTALEDGGALEAKDLEYSKYVLSVRRELPTHKKMIDQRIIDVAVADRRLELAKSFTQLNEAIARLKPKDVAAEAFDQARASADEAQAAIGHGEPLIVKDIPFAKHVASMREKLAASRQTIDRRLHEVTVQRQVARIEEQWRSLQGAIGRLKGDDVPGGLFDEADAAASAVGKVLEEGASLAGKDRDYAARATKIRKQLAEATAQISQRRLAVAVAGKKREIQAVRGQLASSVQRINGKDPLPAEFEEAKKNLGELQGQVDKAESLTAKDLSFGKYIAELRRSIPETRAKIDRRELEVAIGQQKLKIEGARRVLADTLTRIKGREVPEAAFDEADGAVGAATKALEEGSGLASKDAAYSSYATGIRKQLAEASTRIAARRLEVAVDKQTTEIQAAKKALGESLARLRGPAVAEPHLEDARGTLTALEKAVEGGEPLAPKDKKFSGFLTEARKTIQAARTTIDQRQLALEIARQSAKLSEAQAALSRSLSQLSTAEEIQAAEAQVGAVDQAIEEGDKYAAKDAAYSKRASDGRRVAAAARKRIQERKEELAVAEQRAKVETQLENLRGALAALEAPTVSSEQFSEAGRAVDAVEKVLEEGTGLERKVPAYSTYATKVQKALAVAAQRIEQRRIQIAVQERKGALAESLAAAKAGVRATKKPEATSADVQAAEAGLKAAREEIMKGLELERKDAGFAKESAKARKDLEALQSDLEDAKPIVKFKEGPVASLAAGAELLPGLSGQAPEEQKKGYGSVLEHFRSCQREGSGLLSETPRLRAAQFVVARKKLKATAVVSACAERIKAAETKLAMATATLGFYEGPGKALEKAKSLLSEAESAGDASLQAKGYREALQQLESCLESGRMLLYKHPELKNIKFDFEGGRTTLPAVIKACEIGSKSVRGKLKGGR